MTAYPRANTGREHPVERHLITRFDFDDYLPKLLWIFNFYLHMFVWINSTFELSVICLERFWRSLLLKEKNTQSYSYTGC